MIVLVFQRFSQYNKPIEKSDLDAVSNAVIQDGTVALKARVAELEALVKYYEELLRLSRHKLFGASSEQSGHHSDQLSFFNEAEVLVDAKCAGTRTH